MTVQLHTVSDCTESKSIFSIYTLKMLYSHAYPYLQVRNYAYLWGSSGYLKNGKIQTDGL
jgi:hypothetical protein